MGDALNELEGEDEPRPGDVRDVQEAQAVAQKAGGEDLDVAELCNDLEAVYVGRHLGDVVDDGGDAEEGGAAAKVL